jgi:micrococcal nuclease
VKVRISGIQQERTVRLIGIDTPETKKPNTPIECGGSEATDNLCRIGFTDPKDSDSDGLLDERGGNGRLVSLETDPTQDEYDQYGRLLAYVKVRSGGMLNTAQLYGGWSDVYVFNNVPFRRLDAFRDESRRAKRDARGVWGM